MDNLYDYGGWKNKDDFTNFINITQNLKCLNECKITDELFELLQMPNLKIN